MTKFMTKSWMLLLGTACLFNPFLSHASEQLEEEYLINNYQDALRVAFQLVENGENYVNKTEIIGVLADYPDIVHLANGSKETLLHAAARKGFEDIVSIFLNRNSAVDSTNIYGETPLHIASIAGHANVVGLLLRNEANANIVDLYGHTPLHATEKVAIARLLIAGGAEIDKKDNKNNTPLFYAAQQGKVDLVRILIEYGADVHTVCENNTTALHVGRTPRIARLLFAASRNDIMTLFKTEQRRRSDESTGSDEAAEPPRKRSRRS